MTDEAFKNTNRELYRDPDYGGDGNYYCPSIHVTEGGGIGINVAGYVVVKPLKDWHDLATQQVAPPTMTDKLEGAPEAVRQFAATLRNEWETQGLERMNHLLRETSNGADPIKAISDKRIAELEKVIDEAEIMASKFELAMKDLTDFGGYTYDDDFRREIKAISTFRALKADTP